jgi:cell wall-associated NlpC family hydrolase
MLLVAAAGVAAVTVTVALASSSRDTSGPPATSPAAVSDTVDELPTRNSRARAIEPVAGESAESAALPTEEPGDQPSAASAAAPLPKFKNSGPTDDAAISGAEVLENGIALPPIEAPEPVKQIIQAGNQIARAPYLWGGGHGRWLDTGYDCSGSISFALASAGLLGGPLDSSRLMGWGKPGKGRWVTIYSNPGHVYMVVAGVRFDTTGRRSSGSRWQAAMRSGGGFVARHPAGL